ncbi:Serine/threonine-protein kinase PLK [Paragonimus heterotremus]|uniref:Serine/threonine-protein kinase PLK n=1 Tax=Paragonimus heterotremus TaxID=100268 RepID=A0A8J4TD73_9TREM|nr:Serine/threonine-protein kinase PLK [Paragonimus heterotremus]
MSSKDASKHKEPPEVVVDGKNKKTYTRGKFLGKGGFAKCYELIDQLTKEKFAGKVVPKSALVKSSQKEKMQQEICIHRTLKHENIVGFHGYFEDADFIYIVLELCNRRSLLELHKRRRYISEPEARYFLKQIIHGCQYLHRNKVMHRDLKLANLFLSDDLVVKIGDFGLASRIVHEGEKKKTLCGTPNYIAPEVLNKGGHSFEVDCWSLGCILYTLLVGSPPFETNKLEETYARIKQNEYKIPYRISAPASKLIRALLHAEPSMRPSMFTMLDDEFFKDYTPNCLPVSALTTCPRFDAQLNTQIGRRPLSDINPFEDVPITSGGGTLPKASSTAVEYQPNDRWLSTLKKELQTLLSNAKVLEDNTARALEDSEDPACCPIYWVSKWVDYSDKYGLGYQLCDNSSGVVFNDVTRLILAGNLQNLQYIDSDGSENFYTMSEHPASLEKKIVLLNYFKAYMQENLLKAGENVSRREADDMARLPFIRRWFRTRSAIVLHLSNGTLQINFFEDHTKIILCPLMRAVTYIDSNRDFKTYQFDYLQKGGIISDLVGRLEYAIVMIDTLSSGPSTNSAPNETGNKATATTTSAAMPVSSAIRKATAAGTAAVAKGLAAVQKKPAS